MHIHYPGYVMRLYHDKSAKDSKSLTALCSIFCSDDSLDLCEVSALDEPNGMANGENRIKSICENIMTNKTDVA